MESCYDNPNKTKPCAYLMGYTGMYLHKSVCTLCVELLPAVSSCVLAPLLSNHISLIHGSRMNLEKLFSQWFSSNSSGILWHAGGMTQNFVTVDKSVSFIYRRQMSALQLIINLWIKLIGIDRFGACSFFLCPDVYSCLWLLCFLLMPLTMAKDSLLLMFAMGQVTLAAMLDDVSHTNHLSPYQPSRDHFVYAPSQ